MKKIFLLVLIGALAQKNYCQALKHREISGQPYNNYQHKTTFDNPNTNDTCNENSDSTMLKFLEESIQTFKINLEELLPSRFTFNIGFTYPVIDIPDTWERKWEKAFKGIQIPFR